MKRQDWEQARSCIASVLLIAKRRPHLRQTLSLGSCFGLGGAHSWLCASECTSWLQNIGEGARGSRKLWRILAAQQQFR